MTWERGRAPTRRAPSYQRFTDGRHRPPFAWEGSQALKIRVEYVMFPKEGSPQREDDFTIAVATILPDPNSPIPMRQRMEFLVKVKGQVPGAREGATLEGVGLWKFDDKNPQFAEWVLTVDGMALSEPITKEDIIEYLLEIENIGPKRARVLVEAWGTETLARLDEIRAAIPNDAYGAEGASLEAHLGQIPGEIRTILRKARLGASQLLDATRDHGVKRDEFQRGRLLGKANIHGALRRRVLAYYRGKDLVTAVAANPAGTLDIDGMEFRKADSLWRLCGIAEDDIRRVAAGVYYTLMENSAWGHCYMDATSAITKAAGLLKLSDLPQLWFNEHYEDQNEVQWVIVVDQFGNLWPRKLWRAEEQVTERVQALMAHQGKLSDKERVPQRMQEILEQSEIQPGNDQLAALLGLPLHRVALLVGSAGTGKTTIVRLLIELLSRSGLRIIKVVAPTGAAARRATMATGIRATTIHKAIGLKGGSEPEYHEENPIIADAVIVDEVSMVDVTLMSHLLRAISTGTHVYFVGDAQQLPAVGPGAVLRDMMESQVVPVFELVEVRRNSGALLRLAYSVLPEKPEQTAEGLVRGRAFLVMDDEGNPIYPDVEFVPVNFTQNTPDHVVAERILAEVVRRYREIGDPNQVKALVPTKGKKTVHPETLQEGYWDAGVRHQNAAIAQAMLGPVRFGETLYKSMGVDFRVGHRCLWLVNTNDDLFPMVNGQDFDIVGLEEEDGVMKVTIQTLDDLGRDVQYTFRGKDYDGSFELGYARSVHKAQGDGYDTVFITVRPRERLTTELIYTGITRGKRQVVIFGVPEKIWNTAPENHRRKTGLTSRLVKALPPLDAELDTAA